MPQMTEPINNRPKPRVADKRKYRKCPDSLGKHSHPSYNDL